jgi:hypothetical protein
MLVGPTCMSCSTRLMPTPPDRWTFRHNVAQELTVTQVSTMAFPPTWAPRLMKEGISTAPFVTKADRRKIAPGTAREAAR